MKLVFPTGINIHCHVWQIELDQRIIHTLQISALRIGAFGYIEVSDKIGQTVRL